MMSEPDPKTRAAYTATLVEISRTPLGYCPDFPRIARRWEAWWRFEAEGPLLVAGATKSPDVRMDKALEHLEDPDRWLGIRTQQVANTHYVGDALPWVRVDLGPVAMAAYLGAPLHMALREQTTWQDPILLDLAEAEDLHLDPESRWHKLTRTLVGRLAKQAAGSYLVCLPDLSGAIDILANLRGAERLCLDLVDNRATVVRTAAGIVDLWERVFEDLYGLVLGSGAGVTQWLGCWSDSPYTLPTCDFSALIGPAAFRQTCLPSIEEQARRAGRAVFHLDGPDAARHADALAENPWITAIQYTPGAGTPSAVACLPMLRRIQRAGKPLYVLCPSSEVGRLAGELDPRGLVLAPEDVSGPEHADRLLGMIGR